MTDGTQTAQQLISIFVAGPPETVTDLTVIGRTPTTLTIRFTEVDDGLGGPADYAVRHAVSPIDWAGADGSQQIVPGAQVGALREVVVADLEPNTRYDMQLVAFRGTPDVDAVYSEDLSNIATGSTLPIPVALTTSYLVGGYPNTAYSDAIAPASGGDGSYTYVVSDGTLPAGLSLNSTTGEISGTTTGTGMSFFEITATSAGLSDSALYSITVSTNPASGFNLWGVGVAAVMPTVGLSHQIDAALARWETVVTSDPGDLTLAGVPSTACNGYGSLLEGAFVDDVVVLVNVAPNDGVGGTLGFASGCLFAQSTPFTVAGILSLDSDDLAVSGDSEIFTIMWHEIGHVMGIGGQWLALGLIGGTQAAPTFRGTQANNEYADLGGTGEMIPVEGSGGQGTALVHWDEGHFDSEAMTGWIDDPAPISRMTIASLVDIGWFTSFDAADPYELPPCSATFACLRDEVQRADAAPMAVEIAPPFEPVVLPVSR